MNRNIKTIAGNIISKKGRSKTAVPNGIFHISVQFIVVICLIFLSMSVWWFEYFYFDGLYRNPHVILVNEPASFEKFVKEKKHNDYLYSNDIIINANWDATYDFVTFGKLMQNNNAFMAIVFPEDFDEQLNNNNNPDILTYYRTDSLEYMNMKDEIINTHIKEYENYLKEVKGITTTENPVITVGVDAIPTADEDLDDMDKFTRGVAQTIIPLIIFIAVLYVSMSSGTNVIAGEKERGTFAAILMTPIKRLDIVLGNIIGVAIKSIIPALIVMIIAFLTPAYFSAGILSVLNSFILLISLTLFVVSITILISVLNDSVVSAQTAFLPIFLVLIAVCVTCIQNVDNISTFYYFLPVYGHFYGIGMSLCGQGNILYGICCFIVTGIFVCLSVIVSEKLLKKERFTVSGNNITDKDIRNASKLVAKQSSDYVSRPRANIFGYKNNKRISSLSFIVDQILYPLAVLSIFQLLALIPTVILYMRKPEYSQFIYSLKDVSGIPDIISKSFEVMAIFLGDPVFLVFMSLGYIGIIATYILRVRFREKNSYTTLGLNKGNIIKKYLMGLGLGLVLMGSVYVLLIAFGQITPSISKLTAGNVLTIFAGLLMWLPQGAAEEVMFRGFMLPRQGARYGIAFASIFSSILFAGFHSMNVGFTPLAFVNLFLIAFLFALIDYNAGHIWYSCAAHTMWNFLQGNIFGLQVSGNQGASTLLKASYKSGARNVITGGDFGPEGGLAVTIVTVIAILIVWVKWHKKAHDHPSK
ncbi:MAG: ABC transporter permease [Saccharofermentans sp.]|nr:ABC transporter permease [Saccharofermentans sp.]